MLRRKRGGFDLHEFAEVEAEADAEVDVDAELESALDGCSDVEVLVRVETDALRVGTWLETRDSRDLGVAVPVVPRDERGL